MWETGRKPMSTFIKDFIERETISRRNFLFASAAGLTTAAMPGVFGSGMARAATDPALCPGPDMMQASNWTTP